MKTIERKVKLSIESIKTNDRLDKYEDKIISKEKFKKAAAFAEVWASSPLK